MTGLASFKIRGSKEVRNKGYVLIMKDTGHKQYWWDWKEWKKRQASFTPEFWDNYRIIKEQWKKTEPHDFWEPIPEEIKMVKKHFEAVSTWDRAALNSPTQGGGAIVLKTAIVNLFNWVIDNNYFNKILFCNFTHDEINTEFPKELKDTYPNIVSKIMQDAAAKFYHKLPIPAEASVGDHWIH
jgi:DNA polymerase I-like protein with 3'-5' exonuclease and polymerase domains